MLIIVASTPLDVSNLLYRYKPFECDHRKSIENVWFKANTKKISMINTGTDISN